MESARGDTLLPFVFVFALLVALQEATDGLKEKVGFTITPGKIHAGVLADLHTCLVSNRAEQEPLEQSGGGM